MKSPLELDKETVKKYKIPVGVDPSPVAKIGFLQDQLEQIQAMHWRSRVDMLHAARLQESDNEALQEKGVSNMTTHRNEVIQTIGAIEMLKQLIEELRKEYPELSVEE